MKETKKKGEEKVQGEGLENEKSPHLYTLYSIIFVFLSYFLF